MRYFTTVMVLMNLGAAVAAVASKQYYKVGYWISAATITYCAYKM